MKGSAISSNIIMIVFVELGGSGSLARTSLVFSIVAAYLSLVDLSIFWRRDVNDAACFLSREPSIARASLAQEKSWTGTTRLNIRLSPNRLESNKTRSKARTARNNVVASLAEDHHATRQRLRGAVVQEASVSEQLQGVMTRVTHIP